jgi:hypothetical protein
MKSIFSIFADWLSSVVFFFAQIVTVLIDFLFFFVSPLFKWIKNNIWKELASVAFVGTALNNLNGAAISSALTGFGTGVAGVKFYYED